MGASIIFGFQLYKENGPGETNTTGSCRNWSIREENYLWVERTVAPSSLEEGSVSVVVASIIFGFQLYKENGPGETNTTRSRNWSCVASDDEEHPWVMSDAWLQSRNMRRDLPAGLNVERFRSLGMRQDIRRNDIVLKMVKAIRT
ncbi:unnamed protein product [Bemisia tabaci]|uniref:Uncharacterized protein n=1 Tax=Bemisia tabaci TaxID=7038 RepID=A0A9P0A3N3_BEMTA|nr:unnamed protein product [Bemisia tabaci]